MNQFTLYIILGLLVVLGLGIGWHYIEVNKMKAENAQLVTDKVTLQSNNDKLNDAVETNEHTIVVQQQNAATLAQTTQALTDSLSAAETEAHDRTAAIKDQQQLIQTATDTPDILEKQINDDYTSLNTELINATGGSVPNSTGTSSNH